MMSRSSLLTGFADRAGSAFFFPAKISTTSPGVGSRLAVPAGVLQVQLHQRREVPEPDRRPGSRTGPAWPAAAAARRVNAGGGVGHERLRIDRRSFRQRRRGPAAGPRWSRHVSSAAEGTVDCRILADRLASGVRPGDCHRSGQRSASSTAASTFSRATGSESGSLRPGGQLVPAAAEPLGHLRHVHRDRDRKLTFVPPSACSMKISATSTPVDAPRVVDQVLGVARARPRSRRSRVR